MKLCVIVTALLALSACASFPAGTKVAPAFDDPYQLSQNTEVLGAQESATVGQPGR